MLESNALNRCVTCATIGQARVAIVFDRRAGRGTTPPKASAGCRRAGSRGTARPMLPATLAPLDASKTSAITSIYAPRKYKSRNRTAQTRMLENDIQIKPSLSPFHPLPAIGQKLERSKTKIIVFDLNENNALERSIKCNILKPLTPLRIEGFKRKNSLGQIDKKPQQLIRENTYDVLEPLYINSTAEKDTSNTNGQKSDDNINGNVSINEAKDSPKTRFKKAVTKVAKMSSTPETGKLLSLREKQTFTIPPTAKEGQCKLEVLPQSPAQKLNKLSEIFQDLEMKGRRDKMKKENSWF